MSLVNDMLRDLDRRKAAEQPTCRPDGSGLSVAPAPVSASHKRRWLFWLIVIVGILLVLNFAIKVFEEYRDRLAQENRVNQQAGAMLDPPSADSAKPVAIASKVNITRVEISEIETGARIEMLLSKPIEHRIIAIDTREIRIDLQDAQLTDVLPGLTNNRLIRAIDVANDDDSLQLSVKLTDDATFQTYLVTRPGQPSLIVDLISRPGVNRFPEQSVATTSGLDIGEDSGVENEIPEDPEPAGLPDETTDQPASVPVFAKTSRELTLSERDALTNRQAMELVRAGQVTDAVSKLQEFLGKTPKALHSRETLAGIMLSQGQLASATDLIAEGLAQAPENPAFIKLQGRVLMASGEYREALAFLERQYRGQQDTALADQEFLSLLAPLYQRQDRHVEAVRVFRQLLDLNPAQPQWWVGQAISLEALGMREDALAAYLRAARMPEIDARLKKYADGRISLLK